MTKTKQNIIDEIKTHIQRCGADYGTWYVGISNSVNDRLFDTHGVKKKQDAWIYRKASSSQIAREIEEHFVNNLGTDGGGGGGDISSNVVYAYKKTSYTNP
jgi:hypothetical protein